MKIDNSFGMFPSPRALIVSDEFDHAGDLAISVIAGSDSGTTWIDRAGVRQLRALLDELLVETPPALADGTILDTPAPGLAQWERDMLAGSIAEQTAPPTPSTVGDVDRTLARVKVYEAVTDRADRLGIPGGFDALRSEVEWLLGGAL